MRLILLFSKLFLGDVRSDHPASPSVSRPTPNKTTPPWLTPRLLNYLTTPNPLISLHQVTLIDGYGRPHATLWNVIPCRQMLHTAISIS